MSFKESMDKIDFKISREFNALTRIPEEMNVGELNQAVRDLREMLYQEKLKFQKHFNDNDYWEDE